MTTIQQRELVLHVGGDQHAPLWDEAALHARRLIVHIFDGKLPDIADLDGCGSWREIVTELIAVAKQQDRLAVIRLFEQLARQQPALRDLLAGEWAGATDLRHRAHGMHPALYHADDLEILPMPGWLLPSILRERSQALLYAPDGSYKSFLALHLALQIAQQQTVVYIAAEKFFGYRNRIAAWKQHYGQPGGELFLWRQAVFLNDPTSLDEFMDGLVQSRLQPALIAVDTLAQCFVGDENSQKDMGRYNQATQRLTDTFGCAVLSVHHRGRTGEHERGSSALSAHCDTKMRIERMKGDRAKLMSEKSSDDAGFGNVVFRLVPVTLDFLDDGRPATSLVIVQDETPHELSDEQHKDVDPVERAVLTFLVSQQRAGVSYTDVITQLKRPNCSEERLKHALKTLEHKRLARKGLGDRTRTNKRDPWYCTPAGIVALEAKR